MDQELSRTDHDRTRDAILAKLAELGSLTVPEDSLRFEGSAFILPEAMRGDVNSAIRYLQEWDRAQSARTTIRRTFRYRPYDGAAAFERAMRRLFGSAGVGASTKGMGGENPPELITIDVDLNRSAQVPWGAVEFSPLEATFYLDDTRHPEDGNVFYLAVEAPRRHKAHIEALFKMIEDELRRESIYRGKALTAATTPQFIDTAVVDRNRVVYSDDAMTQLDANLWSVIRHAEANKSVGLSPKRQVLLYGPYGTGKTSAGLITAQEALAHGWTYLQVRPGDDLNEALKTAALYAPCVVMFEDIDTIALRTGMDVSRILDALDGVTSKGVEILAIFTTNHVESLHKGLMRPGRLDAVIELAGLDAGATKRLVRATVPAHLLADGTDWDAVGKAFDGLLPAFATEAIGRALRYAIARSGGVPQMITGDDLIGAANGLRTQVRMMEDAPELSHNGSVDEAIAAILQGHVVNYAGDNLPIVRA